MHSCGCSQQGIPYPDWDNHSIARIGNLETIATAGSAPCLQSWPPQMTLIAVQNFEVAKQHDFLVQHNVYVRQQMQRQDLRSSPMHSVDTLWLNELSGRQKLLSIMVGLCSSEHYSTSRTCTCSYLYLTCTSMHAPGWESRQIR